MQAGRGPGQDRLLADIHRDRAHEGVRGRHVDAGQGPLPPGPGGQGHAERGHQRDVRHLPEGDGQAGLLHAPRLLAVRGGRAGRARDRRRQGRRPGGLRGQRARAARRAELGAEEPLRPGAGRSRAPPRGLRHRRLDRDAGRPAGRAAARRGGAGHRPRADRAAGGAAPDRLRGPCRRRRSRSGALRARRAAGRRGLRRSRVVGGGGRRRRTHRRPRRGPGVPGRRRWQQPAGRAGRPALPGPRPGRRHRQVPAGPAVERVLREGAGRPVLAQLRPGRYDPEYELEGRDYPIGYVRWTERRNLACFLDLMARGRVDVDPRRPTSPTSTTPWRRTGV